MARVETDGLLEGAHGAAMVFLRVPEVTALQVPTVGLEVRGLRAGLYGLCSRAEPGLHGLDHSRSNLVLHGEYIGGVAVESLRPEVIPARDLGELRRDAKAVTRRAHAALEDVPHRQRVGDRLQPAAVVPGAERRVA